MLIKIIYAILLVGGGAAVIKYRRDIKRWSGGFMWAEKYLGRGGTYLVLIFTGLAMIFFGFIYPFGGVDMLLGR